MKKIKLLTILIILLAFTISGYSQGYHKRIAFIGNSITQGATLTDIPHEKFSVLVDSMLRKDYGDTCIVGNFAVSGRTMLKHGDYPIWNEQFFTDCWQFAPDIFIICLGTNDSKPYNWDPYSSEFFSDYMSMIDTFKLRNPYTKFIVSRPPPAFGVVFDIRDTVIRKEVIPLVDSVAKVTGAAVVDYYHALLDSAILFPDKIHPNARGHKAMANIIYDKLIETDCIHQTDTGYTFVNHFTSSKTLARDKDSITLSWTTINADTAWLDGTIVPLTGSKKVNDKTTTNYILKAKGKLSIDSLVLKQKYYHQYLAKIAIPTKITTRVGDTATITTRYFDQENVLINDTTYNIEWSVVEGEGSIVEKPGKPGKFFVGTAEGTAKISSQLDSITSNVCDITIKPSLINIINERDISVKEVLIFPNPVKDLLNITIPETTSTIVKIRIYDIMGVLQLEQTQSITNKGQHTFGVKTDGLSSGLYFIQIEYSDKHVVRKINLLGI
jgi:acyl-CoA thioesterase I